MIIVIQNDALVPGTYGRYLEKEGIHNRPPLRRQPSAGAGGGDRRPHPWRPGHWLTAGESGGCTFSLCLHLYPSEGGMPPLSVVFNYAL